MWNKLKNLLLHYFNGDELERYKYLLDNETAPSIRSITILTKEAVNTYGIRAKSPAALSGKVIGFTKLLEVLSKIDDSQVSIHKLSINDENVSVIFTDHELTKILGILYFLG